ncbi:MAG: LD-carboxypeptidase [Betaproteobacteria bacterium]|jgi:muramoyltetrapeptide carboxypeptidase
MTTSTALTLFAASGVETRRAHVKRARQRLKAMGYDVTEDSSVRLRHQRFAGTDEQRLDTLHRVADQAPSVALACRGGYGMTRLLDAVQWKRIKRSVERGTRWVGYSDMTVLSLALLAHTGAPSWHGPMAAEDFGRELGLDAKADEANHITCETFDQAMHGELEALGFRTEARWDGFGTKGMLWGGNLSMVCSLLGTRHWPNISGGLLYLEDVGEHPYRVERMLLQLAQAGVLARQRAVLLGQFSAWKAAPLDRGYGLKAMIKRVAEACPKTALITGLPLGHVPLNLTLPQGSAAVVQVEGRTAYLFL